MLAGRRALSSPVNPAFGIAAENAVTARRRHVLSGIISRRRAKAGEAAETASTARLRQIEREVDQEQALQIGAAGLGFFGAILSVAVNPAFALLPAMAFAALGQYAVQGWCPPIALLRRLGLRSCREIDGERYALSAAIAEPLMPEVNRAGAD
jgi:hypothetical protein